MKHPEFEDCLKRKKISKFSGAPKLSGRELKTARGGSEERPGKF